MWFYLFIFLEITYLITRQQAARIAVAAFDSFICVGVERLDDAAAAINAEASLINPV